MINARPYLSLDSQFAILNKVTERFDQWTIKNEPMLFNCNLEHAYLLGGPITRAFLDKVPKDWKTVPLVIDSRVHMLMTDWYPCIPGWHHDDVPRDRADGQPEYEKPTYRSKHIMMLSNADICPTEFAVGKEDFCVPETGKTFYSEWHKDVNKYVKNGFLKVHSCPDQTLIQFDDRTWHRGVAANTNGWRFFIRVSRYFDPEGNTSDRLNPRTNEIRRQAQVYMPAINAGW